MKPNKVYDLMNSFPDGASFAVHIEGIIAALLQKTRFNGIQTYTTPYIMEQVPAIHVESIRQGSRDLWLTDVPMMRI